MIWDEREVPIRLFEFSLGIPQEKNHTFLNVRLQKHILTFTLSKIMVFIIHFVCLINTKKRSL